MNPLSLRLLGQQLSCPEFSTPHDVVSWMGAMQGQDYRAMRWAVGMRTGHPSEKAFREAFNSGSIIRTHLFRSTWHLVAAEDYGWMIDLCSDKSRSGIRGWIKQSGVVISEDEELRFREFISGALRGRGSLDRSGIESIVLESGFPCRPEHIKYQLYLAEVSGVICSGNMEGNERTWILSSDKIASRPLMTRSEALEELARRYFRSHSPATFEDYVWWTGLNAGECRQGIEALGDELVRERWKGLEFYVHRDCRTRGCRSGKVLLLPPYDEYLIGYKSRQVALPPEYRHRAHDQKGIFWPVILLDGKVVGNWSASGLSSAAAQRTSPASASGSGSTASGASPASASGSGSASSRSPRITVDLFNPASPLPAEALQKEIDRYVRFCGN